MNDNIMIVPDLWTRITKGWSNQLKNKILKIANGNLNLIPELCELVNLAMEEEADKAPDCDNCDKCYANEPRRDESRD